MSKVAWGEQVWKSENLLKHDTTVARNLVVCEFSDAIIFFSEHSLVNFSLVKSLKRALYGTQQNILDFIQWNLLQTFDTLE